MDALSVRPRVLVIGASLAGLTAAIEAVGAGAAVDIVTSLADIKIGEPNAKLTSSPALETLVSGASVGAAAGGAAGAAGGAGGAGGAQLLESHEALAQRLLALPRTTVRLLLQCTPQVLLLSDEKRCVGVRCTTKTAPETTVFGDAVIIATGTTCTLNQLEPSVLSQVSNSGDGAPFTVGDGYQSPAASGGGLFVAGVLNENHGEEAVAIGRAVALEAVKYAQEIANRYGSAVRRCNFVDSGVVHRCALHPDRWTPLKLRERIQLNKFNHLFRFDLPNPTDQLGFLSGQYLSIRATLDGKVVERFYSPVSRNTDFGKIELVVKIEEGKLFQGSMAAHFMSLNPGDTIDFKGPLGGFQYHRNTYREVGMIAGGTGITPMLQIIRSVTKHADDNTHVKLLYGNFIEDDILCKEELMYLAATRNNINVHVTLANPPPHWAMGVGFINEEMLRQHLPSPADDIIVVICGPPPMIKIIAWSCCKVLERASASVSRQVPLHQCERRERQ